MINFEKKPYCLYISRDCKLLFLAETDEGKIVTCGSLVMFCMYKGYLDNKSIRNILVRLNINHIYKLGRDENGNIAVDVEPIQVCAAIDVAPEDGGITFRSTYAAIEIFKRTKIVSAYESIKHSRFITLAKIDKNSNSRKILMFTQTDEPRGINNAIVAACNSRDVRELQKVYADGKDYEPLILKTAEMLKLYNIYFPAENFYLKRISHKGK